MQFGDIDLQLVSGRTYCEDGGRLFGLVPRVLWEQIAKPDEQNRLCLGVRCLLIRTNQQCILVGTGPGNMVPADQLGSVTPGDQPGLLSNLEKLGVAPDQVDLVINTHLHKHHCGGNTRLHPDGELVPTFPRAMYCVQRLELADARFPNERTRYSYSGESLGPLEHHAQLRILNGDTRLSAGVRVMVAPGHTRAHQCVVIESGARKALFLGDAAHWPVHLERLSWVSSYDVEPLVSIETKRNLARWAVENRALVIFEHHPKIESGYLHATKRPDRFRLEPIAISG
jgi:glyoxylase-like metal-dependent hydrolase (beta-lactamase superfamily II)